MFKQTARPYPYRLLILGILLTSAIGLSAQSMDQLRATLAKTSSSEQRLPLLQALTDSLWDKDPESARKYLDQLIADAEKIGAEVHLGYASERKGGLAYSSGQSDNARTQYLLARDHYLRGRDTIRALKVWTRAGIMYSIQGDYPQAESIYREVMRKGIAKPEVQAFVWNQLGTLYHYQGQVDSANAYYEQSASAYERLADTTGMLRPMYNQAVLFNEQGRTEEGASILLRVSEFQKRTGAINDLALSSHALADHFRTQGDLKQAMEYAKLSYSCAKQAGNDQRLISALISLARISGSNRDTSTAIQYLEEGLAFARKGNNIQQIQTLLYYLGNTYLERREYGLALSAAREGLQLSKGQSNNRTLPYLLITEGMALRHLGHHNEAVSALARSAEMADEFRNHDAASIARQQLAETYLEQGLTEKAWKVSRDAWDRHSPHVQPQSNLELAGTLHRLGKKLKRWEDALYFHEKMKVLHDSLNNTEKVRQHTLESKDFAFQLERERLEADRRKSEAILEEKALRNRIVALALTLLAAVTFVFFWQSRRKNRIISEKNRQLEQLNLTKDHLFAIIGHDLRKPAIGFRGIVKKVNYLLQKKDFATLNALGDQIEDNARELNQLTDNLLHWALSQKDVLDVRPQMLNLGEACQQAVQLFTAPAIRKRVTLTARIDPELRVFADPDALQTIIRNLVDNALKYTPSEGEIVLTGRDNAVMTELEIRDSGTGIAPELLKELFELQRGKSTPGTDGEKGTGLGLHLVRELVQRLDGQIRVESEPGKGSAFFVLLPKESSTEH